MTEHENRGGQRELNVNENERPRELPPHPRIYVASLSAYNSSYLHGAWVDAGQEPDRIQGEIDDMLERSPDPDAEEWAIHDYEGFGQLRLSEHESVETISNLGLCISEHGPAFAAYASVVGASIEALRGFDDAYQGHWDSVEDFVRDLVEEFGWQEALSRLPDGMQAYVSFEYTQLVHDLQSEMDIVPGQGGVFIFSSR